jgi:hypothetical protein
MLSLAPDSSTIELKFDQLYPGEIVVVDWELCIVCDKEVDGYIYVGGSRRAYCAEHYGYYRNLIYAE